MQLNSDISAIITGGASGLGAATARRLASRGVKVAIFDMNETVGQTLASELGGVYCNVDARQIASIALFRSTWWALSVASPSQPRVC